VTWREVWPSTISILPAAANSTGAERRFHVMRTWSGEATLTRSPTSLAGSCQHQKTIAAEAAASPGHANIFTPRESICFRTSVRSYSSVQAIERFFNLSRRWFA
jgi:hypothetical protein